MRPLSGALLDAALRACPPSERERLEASLRARAPSPERRAQGRAAQAQGSTWETLLEHHHREAARLGLAYVVHTGPVVAFGRGGEPVVIGRGGADYHGTLRGGRSLAAEAKSFEGRCARSSLPEHQCDELSRVEALGGLALLLLELRPGGRYAVPWGAIPWKRRGEHERGSVGAEELAPWAIGDGCYLARWVS